MSDDEVERREAILEALAGYHSHSDWLDPLWGVLINSETIPGYVVAVSVDHDEHEPSMHIYTWDQLEAWYARALQYIEENPTSQYDEDEECDLAEAFGETAEDTIGTADE